PQLQAAAVSPTRPAAAPSRPATPADTSPSAQAQPQPSTGSPPPPADSTTPPSTPAPPPAVASPEPPAQGINLAVSSEKFSDPAWRLDRASIEENAAAAPDGTITASRLVELAEPGLHRVETRANGTT